MSEEHDKLVATMMACADDSIQCAQPLPPSPSTPSPTPAEKSLTPSRKRLKEDDDNQPKSFLVHRERMSWKTVYKFKPNGDRYPDDAGFEDFLENTGLAEVIAKSMQRHDLPPLASVEDVPNRWEIGGTVWRDRLHRLCTVDDSKSPDTPLVFSFYPVSMKFRVEAKHGDNTAVFFSGEIVEDTVDSITGHHKDSRRPRPIVGFLADTEIPRRVHVRDVVYPGVPHIKSAFFVRSGCVDGGGTTDGKEGESGSSK